MKPSVRWCSASEAKWPNWKDRPVGELIDFFGVPRQIMVVPEEDLVVLRYVRDSSYVTREAAGTYTGPQNRQLVHTEYWEDVQHSRGRRTGSLCTRNTGKMCSTQVAVRSMCSSTEHGWCRRYARKNAAHLSRWRRRLERDLADANHSDRLRRSPPVIRHLT